MAKEEKKETQRSQAYKDLENLIERYKRQNPSKAAAKEAEFARKLKALE